MLVPVTVSAPATTANLGPGYDCLALALEPRCRVTAVLADQWSVQHVGAHRPPEGAVDAVLAAAEGQGGRPLRLVVDNEVPIGKGVGSSAAALTAGVAAALAAEAMAVGGNLDLRIVFDLAAEMEGHADQVGAAVYGGMILVAANGEPVRLPFHESLRVVVAIPDQVLSTKRARQVVPAQIPIEVAVRSLSRIAGLVAGVGSGRRELLEVAGGDEIHEAPRAPLSPIVPELIEIARNAGAWHAARSGAGPSVFALCSASEAPGLVEALTATGAQVLESGINQTGLEVRFDD